MIGELSPKPIEVTMDGSFVINRNLLSQIPVETFLSKHNVEDQKTVEAVKEFPTLAYLLGEVSENPIVEPNSLPNGVEKYFRVLKSGSGLFGLKDAEDANRWKGIFNHIIGTSRQTLILAEHLSSLDHDQRDEFSQRGYNVNSLYTFNPLFLRDFMLVSHAGRRESDEAKWYNLDDNSHRTIDSAKASILQLHDAHAPNEFIDLMRVETHGYLKNEIIENSGLISNFDDISLSVSDWMFGQDLTRLEDRFAGLRKSGRASNETLDVLEQGALNFQTDFEEITGEDLFGIMLNAKAFDWEVKIREAYCSPSGINPLEAFPGFHAQFPALS